VIVNCETNEERDALADAIYAKIEEAQP